MPVVRIIYHNHPSVPIHAEAENNNLMNIFGYLDIHQYQIDIPDTVDSNSLNNYLKERLDALKSSNRDYLHIYSQVIELAALQAFIDGLEKRPRPELSFCTCKNHTHR